MVILVVGLILFLGVHSVRIVAEPWREQIIAERGDKAWKGIYSVLSVVGLVLIIWGFGRAWADPILLWTPPHWGPHLTWLLTLVAFILFGAASKKVGHIKAAISHPMAAGVALWAAAHLFANGTLADLVLFGAFLIWGVADYVAACRREQPDRSNVQWRPDIVAVVSGVVIWLVFFLWLHQLLIGVSPMT